MRIEHLDRASHRHTRSGRGLNEEWAEECPRDRQTHNVVPDTIKARRRCTQAAVIKVIESGGTNKGRERPVFTDQNRLLLRASRRRRLEARVHLVAYKLGNHDQARQYRGGKPMEAWGCTKGSTLALEEDRVARRGYGTKSPVLPR
jgi:hypothetical protein